MSLGGAYSAIMYEDRPKTKWFQTTLRRIGYFAKEAKYIKDLVGDKENELLQAVRWNASPALRDVFLAEIQRQYKPRSDPMILSYSLKRWQEAYIKTVV